MIIKIDYYFTATGKAPFIDWLHELDLTTRAVIKTRIDRISLGNFGDCKRIVDGEGIWELRIDYGPGYRIYFGQKYRMLVFLLIGGNKNSQKRDINKAKRFWRELQES